METSSSKKLPEPSTDRISNLPDSVLCHILDFLPTADAVATCVLSPRWKDVWTDLPNLRFDDALKPFNDKSAKKQDKAKRRFAKFINRVMILHKAQSMENYTLHCTDNYWPYDISTWVAAAISKGVKALDLGVSRGPAVKVPSRVFTCQTLEVLELQGCLLIYVPSIVCLPKLRILRLDKVEYQNEKSADKLISSCPSLESVLIHQKMKFNLCKYTISSSTWRALINPSLQCLDLSLLYLTSQVHPVPSFIFICKTLQVLKLTGHFSIDIPCWVYLPSLRMLELLSVKYQDKKSVCNLISSCESLESLFIENSSDYDSGEFRISSSTVRNLKIRFMGGSSYIQGNSSDLRLVINAPALQHLDLCDEMLKNFHLEDVSSLVAAKIDIMKRRGLFGYIDFREAVTNLFQGLCNVKTLSLSHQTLQVLKPEHLVCKFHRLTELKVEAQWCNWGLLQKLIENSDKLEDFGLDRDLREAIGHSICWRDPERVPKSILTSLKTVSFDGFQGLEDEIDMISYILKNGGAIQTVKVSMHRYIARKTKVKVSAELLKVQQQYKKLDIQPI